MKHIIIAAIALSLSTCAFAKSRASSTGSYSSSRQSTVTNKSTITVSAYKKKDGTVVAKHKRTMPDGNKYNNLTPAR